MGSHDTQGTGFETAGQNGLPFGTMIRRGALAQELSKPSFLSVRLRN